LIKSVINSVIVALARFLLQPTDRLATQSLRSSFDSVLRVGQKSFESRNGTTISIHFQIISHSFAAPCELCATAAAGAAGP